MRGKREVSYKIKEILKYEYENKMISNGNNFPKIDLCKNNLKEICVLLHNKVPAEEMRGYLGISQNELVKRLELLEKEELLKRRDSNYIPNLMVISLEEGKELFKYICEIANEIVELIEENVEIIKEETYKFQCLKQFDFNELSLFILSGVILDFIQIDNVESMFLKAERTRRNGMNYYYSLLEKNKGASKEAFGIYGNMFRYYGNIGFGLYGNERNGENFHTIDISAINKYFGSFINENKDDIKQYLLEELLKYHYENDYLIKPNIIAGFNHLGIMKGSKINIPILNKNDFYKLNNIADIIKKDYVNIFERNRDNLYYYYNGSNYAQEITFEEYFIWWYHLLYSKVTDLLIEKKIIEIPNAHNFSYIVS